MRKTLKKPLFLLSFLFFLNVLAWAVVFDLRKTRFLKVDFFDVGQGDAIFIEDPQLHQILIDGGPDSVILEKLGESLPFYDRSLDLIILTHPERDHMDGLIEVLKRYRVENILWTGVLRDTVEYNVWKSLIKKEKAKVFIAKAGQEIKTDSSPPLVFKILYPLQNLEGEMVKNSNDTSIVAQLIFGKSSFLFTGDASKSTEKKLLEENTYLDSDVLKVGHHGSKTSSSEKFIEKVSPEVAVISVGRENRYGHPCQKVLENLAKYGIKVLRTDRDGDIKIISDGKNYKILKKERDSSSYPAP